MYFTFLIIASIVGFLIGIHLHMKIRSMDKLLGHIPHPPRHPLFGHLPNMLQGKTLEKVLGPHVQSYGEKCKKFSFYNFAPDVIVSQPSAVKTLLYSANNRGTAFNAIIRETLGVDGLFTMTHGEKWRDQRKLVTNVFNPTNLHRLEWIFKEQAIYLIQKWQTLQKVPLFAQFKHLIFGISCQAIFGFSTSILAPERKNSEVQKALDFIMEKTSARVTLGFFPYWRWLPFANYQLKKHQQVVQNLFASVLEHKKESSLPVNNVDLLDLFLENEGISSEDIYANCLTFLLAGRDTTASALTYVCHLLGENPNIQTILRESLLGLNLKEALLKQIQSISYLEQVVKEGLRLYPPAFGVRREMETELQLLDTTILPTTSVFVPLKLMYCDNKYWDNASSFLPQRFDTDNENLFIPFGLGLRACPGKHFALAIIKITLSFILLHFKILKPLEPLSTSYGMALLPSENTSIAIELIKRVKV